jgi:hypothetical protein
VKTIFNFRLRTSQHILLNQQIMLDMQNENKFMRMKMNVFDYSSMKWISSVEGRGEKSHFGLKVRSYSFMKFSITCTHTQLCLYCRDLRFRVSECLLDGVSKGYESEREREREKKDRDFHPFHILFESLNITTKYTYSYRYLKIY